MKLSDLKPQEVTFEACGVELTFRPFLITDDLNSHDVIGSAEEFSEALTNFDFKKLSVLAWYQLDIKSQRNVIKSVEGVYLDAETGDEVDANLTPIQKFRQLFAGIGDQKELIQNLLRCRGLNMPDLEDGDAIKKWLTDLNELKIRIGL